MLEQIGRIRNPRCFLVYALAPEGLSAPEANTIFNRFIGRPGLPLVIYHDHFIGESGGVAIFYVETAQEREALINQTDLHGWEVEYRPLIYSRSPGGFDEQVAFTLRAYRGIDWDELRRQMRPRYGHPSTEVGTDEGDLD